MKLELADPEVDYIMRCLMARPYGEVVGLINKIQGQANAQVAPVAPAPVAPAPAAE